MANQDVTEAAPPLEELPEKEVRPSRTLGQVKLRNPDTKEIILVPAPSTDPNDPLNWPIWYKRYMAGLICLAMMMCNFLAAGPTIAILETAGEFFPNEASSGHMLEAIARTAYFFTTTALLQGVGNFIWIPLCNKYGRRLCYVASYSIYLAATVWLIYERSYGGFLAGRIIMGFGAGAAETIAPLSIADVFFLHERGAMVALYTAFLSVGVSFGIIICGMITINHNWRVTYEVAAGMVALVLLLAFFTFPETAYKRANELSVETEGEPASTDPPGASDVSIRTATVTAEKRSYLQDLRLLPAEPFTSESLWRLFVRPFGLILLPDVLWATLVQSVTIGFLVAVTSNVSPAFKRVYGFETWQVGVCFLSAIIGALLGMPAGGTLGDFVADFFTKRNGGVREPEMRLPAMLLCMVSTPLALVLFGVGIGGKLHWMCPTVALGLLNFSITQGTNVALVYVIDAYRPVAGEVTLTVTGFKSMFGFLLSFYTNPWIARVGYRTAYGTMSGIAAGVLVMWIPLYFYGAKLRRVVWRSPVVGFVKWLDDREVGE